MEYFEDWKALVFDTDKELKRRRGAPDFARAALLVLAVALCSAVYLVFGGLADVAALLGISPAVLVLADAALEIAVLLVSCGFVHLVARHFGGKGSYLGSVSVVAEALLPFSIASFLVFVPFVGNFLAGAACLASLYVFVIYYKVLKVKYGLAQDKAVAALLVGEIAFAVVALVAAGAVAGYFIFAFIQTGGVQPTITQTADGCHYYSPLHGGYSFDCPPGWAAGNLSSQVKGGNLSFGTKAFAAFTQNEFMSLAFLRGGETNKSIMVAFIPRGNYEKISLDSCNSGNTMIMKLMERNWRFDLSEAGVEYGYIGELPGCLITDARVTSGGKSAYIDMFLSDACADGHTLMVMEPGEAYPTMGYVVGSMQCGSNATK